MSSATNSPHASLESDLQAQEVLPGAPTVEFALGCPPVSFYSPDLDPKEIDELSCERDWRYFGGNTHKIWIVQTYLRLRAAGYPVRLAQTLPREGVVVVENASRKALVREFGPSNHALIVAIRADHRPQLYADLEVIQNDYFADERRVFVPHWPQPGILPRDSARGTQVRNLSFKGHAGCLHVDFQGERWSSFLREEELDWCMDGVAWHGNWSKYDDCEWPDYRQVDIAISVRENWDDLYLGKPSSKLINAWHAGVPAIVGPDYAFEAERRSDLDFLQVHSLEEAMSAVRRLKTDPALYSAMVANGLKRAEERTAERVTAVWADLLFRVCAEPARARAAQRLRIFDWWWKLSVHRAQRLLPEIRTRRQKRARNQA